MVDHLYMFALLDVENSIKAAMKDYSGKYSCVRIKMCVQESRLYD